MDRIAKYANLQNPNSNQLPTKFRLHEQTSDVKGAVLWYAETVAGSISSYGTAPHNYYWKYPALQPEMSFIDSKRPKKSQKLELVQTSDGYILFWTGLRGKDQDDATVKYVAYRFNKGECVSLDSPSRIVAVTTEAMYKLSYAGGETRCRYVVTALDGVSNESKAKKKSIRL